jgi:NADH:ubiquinone oxidoreductase subunit 6 (subunit J)
MSHPLLAPLPAAAPGAVEPLGSVAALVLPLLAGAGAIYLLLPRPRHLPARYGLALAVLALVLAAFLVVPTTVARPETVLFYAFSALALVFGGLLVTQRNPARAAISFAVVVLSVCGLFLLLAAPFLMAASIVIYAGAIVVTFLFVLMLARVEGPSNANDRSREPLLTTLTGFLMLGVLAYVLHQSYGTAEIDHLIGRTRAATTYDSRAEIDRAVGEVDAPDGLFRAWTDLMERHGLGDLLARVKADQAGWLQDPDPAAKKRRLEHLAQLGDQARDRLAALQPPGNPPLSDLSGPRSSEDPANIRRDAEGLPALPAQNAAYLGRSLFTDFLLPVELGGTLLLVATVGAIAIAHRRAPVRPGRAP